MGNFDCKNICLQIKIKENLTDWRYLEFVNKWNFTMDDYLTFYESVKGTIFNEVSERIVEFFVNYKDGILRPDRCGTYDPLKHKFRNEDVFKYQSWLSFPSGCLIFKRNRLYSAEIKNRYWGLSWSGNNPIVTKPKRILPEYLGKITFWFPKQRKQDMCLLETLIVDFCSYLKTDYGIIFDQENYKVLFDLSNPDNVGTFLENVTFD
jgi:hypothetical protein